MKMVRVSNEKWLFGPWESKSPVEIGCINKEVFGKKPRVYHFHKKIFEYFLVSKGWARLRVGDEIIKIKQGENIMVEPTERHGLVEISNDFECFVVKYPHAPKDAFD